MKLENIKEEIKILNEIVNFLNSKENKDIVFDISQIKRYDAIFNFISYMHNFYVFDTQIKRIKNKVYLILSK